MLDEHFIMDIFYDIGKNIPGLEYCLEYLFEIKTIKDCRNLRGSITFWQVDWRAILFQAWIKTENKSGFNNIGVRISNHDNDGIDRY